MPKRLTDRAIRALKPAEPGRRYMIVDAVVPGLAVRVTDKGALSFILQARYPGSLVPTRRFLGAYGDLSLEDARKKASAWRKSIREGRDPAREEKRRRDVDATNTFGVVAEAFLSDIKRRGQRKETEVARDVRRELIARWGKHQIASITPADVMAMVDAALKRDAPAQARNLLGYAKRIFNWALARDAYGLVGSPCDRLKPSALIGRKAIRTRTLSDEELRAFWKAAGDAGYPYAPVFKLLAVTAQRKSEVAQAMRRELDLDVGLWSIPAVRMKAERAHEVPLSPLALAIFRGVPKVTKGPYLFSTTFGKKPVGGFGKAKRRLDGAMLAELKKAAIERREDPGKVVLEPWVLHDLRRTARTRLSALRVSDMVAELVIAHTKKGLHAVYDQHSYRDEKRDALERWAAALQAIIDPPPSNIVPMAAAGAVKRVS